MRLRAVSLPVSCCSSAPFACRPAQSNSVSFNLSTSKTFAPGEQPKIHLYTHNVDALEFRVYRVNDPVKFMENLRELHSFGPEAGLLGKSRSTSAPGWRSSTTGRPICGRASATSSATSFPTTRAHVAARRSRAPSSATAASSARRSSRRFPILNQSQLVSRWRQLVPATYISDSNDLAVPKLNAGLYLLEATDGRFKAYTLLMVTEMALVTRTSSGNVTAYVVDRVTGQPIAGAKVDAGFGQKLADSATTDANGTAQLAVPGDKSEQDNFWVVAGKGDEFAASTPSSWALTMSASGKYAGYVYTERPVYRPTHTVHWKAILREHNGNSLALPKPGNVHVVISDENDKAVFDKQMPLSAAGDVSGDFDLPKDAALGYYSIRVGDQQDDAISGGFHVEDYRKPEYRVQVTANQKRVLEGATMPVTIDSRYFFGEPVANATVKYRVYQERHYWWGEEEDDSATTATAPTPIPAMTSGLCRR